MQEEAANLLEPLSGLHIMRVPSHLQLAGHLEVVLLLADEGLVYLGEVEPFVGTHYVGWGLSVK